MRRFHQLTKIAEALFNGQMVAADGKEPLSLYLIAANKHRSGWGRIFKQLKANGLLDAKILGDLMSECYQQSTAVISVTQGLAGCHRRDDGFGTSDHRR